MAYVCRPLSSMLEGHISLAVRPTISLGAVGGVVQVHLRARVPVHLHRAQRAVAVRAVVVGGVRRAVVDLWLDVLGGWRGRSISRHLLGTSGGQLLGLKDRKNGREV